MIVTGIALILNREFNEFSELFNPLDDQESEDDLEKEEREKKESDQNENVKEKSSKE